MKYKIIKVYGCPEIDNLEMELEDEVNMYISEGWKPFGSPCVVNVVVPEKHEKNFQKIFHWVGKPENHDKNLVEVWQSMVKETDNE